jgi:hypothetical protein
LDGNLKVKIIDRKIYLPKDLIEKASLPKRGVCEAVLVGDEVRIRRETSTELNILKILEKPPTRQKIEDIMRAEEVEDV